MRHCANTSSGGHTEALNVVCGGERWLIGTVSSPPLFLLLSCGFSQGPPPCWTSFPTARLHQITSQKVCLSVHKGTLALTSTQSVKLARKRDGFLLLLLKALFLFYSLRLYIFMFCMTWGLPEVPVWRGFRIKERRSPWQCSHNRLYSSIKVVIMWNGTHGPMMSVAAQTSSCKLSYIYHQSIFLYRKVNILLFRNLCIV